MRRHLTYANVVASLALFVALGGTGYAALVLPKNSVTTVQVKNGSLLAQDFKKGQLKAGPRGPAGLTGATGPAGLAGKDGAQGIQGIQGVPGQDGSAKAYAYVGADGTVGPNSKGIATSNITQENVGEYCFNGLSFTPRVALVQPDILTNDLQPNMVSEVQTPSEGEGGGTCTNAQIYVRIAYETVSGSSIVRTGQKHAFFIEVN